MHLSTDMYTRMHTRTHTHACSHSSTCTHLCCRGHGYSWIHWPWWIVWGGGLFYIVPTKWWVSVRKCCCFSECNNKPSKEPSQIFFQFTSAFNVSFQSTLCLITTLDAALRTLASDMDVEFEQLKGQGPVLKKVRFELSLPCLWFFITLHLCFLAQKQNPSCILVAYSADHRVLHSKRGRVCWRWWLDGGREVYDKVRKPVLDIEGHLILKVLYTGEKLRTGSKS